MAEFPTSKKVADATAGRINRANRSLVEAMDIANKNIFDIILIPNSFGGLASIGTGLLDNIMMKAHVQSISFNTKSFEYNEHNETKSVKGINYVDSIALTLVDSEVGLVRTYLKKWYNEVYDDFWGVFRDNQEGSLKNGFLIPQTRMGLPSLTWFELLGLQIQSFGEFSFEQGNGEPLMITLTCKVDDINIYELI